MTTATGWTVRTSAMDAFSDAFDTAGDRDGAMFLLEQAALREDWARRTVAAAGKSWDTHRATFSGAVLPR